MRHLMSVKKITKITPIEGADRIETATVGGWDVVVRKGLYAAGDSVVYMEIDSVLPECQDVFSEFQKFGVKNVETPGGVIRGHVLKTVKLRGQVSQGAILPLDALPGVHAGSTQEEVDRVAEQLGVFKYVPPAVFSQPDIVGVFPSKYATKTDSERVQNLGDEWLGSCDPEQWYATEKLDGTSVTFFVDEQGVFRIASRNYEVDSDLTAVDPSPYARVARQYDLPGVMQPGEVIQGEIVGEKINGNKLRLKGVQFFVFHAENVAPGSPAAQFVSDHTVPRLDFRLPETMMQAVSQVDGMKSVVNPEVQAEGVVWWHCDGVRFPELGGRANFKAINNKFLLKNG